MSWPKAFIRNCVNGLTGTVRVRGYDPATQTVRGSFNREPDKDWPLSDVDVINTECAHAHPELAKAMKGKVIAVGYGANEKQAAYDKESKDS